MPPQEPTPASLSTLARAIRWAEMARGERRIGTVRSRTGSEGERWFIDFGRRWAPRFLYSFRGVRFENAHMAEAILAHIELEVAKPRPLGDILSELAPEASADGSIETLVDEWLEIFERKVRIGDRQPRTLRDYQRWARREAKQRKEPENHFAWWYGRSIWEIDEASVEAWSS